MSITVKKFSGSSHRTALVIDVNDFNKGDYRERVQRLLQSVNGPNIKADIFALKDSVLTKVNGIDDIKAVANASAGTDSGAEDVREWAAENGYTQVIVNSPV